MVRWRPALRMAWRDLRRHKLRSALTMFLVALPVLVGVTVSLVHHNTRWEGEQQARVTMGGADAVVRVTAYPRTRVVYEDGGYLIARPTRFTRDDSGKRHPVRRDRTGFDLGSLLPTGSRLIPAPVYRDVALATGGSANTEIINAGDPMSLGLAAIDSGRAPTAADEVAVNAPMARELEMLDADGALKPDATLTVRSGTALHVVGLVKADSYTGTSDMARLLAALTSVLAGDRPHYDYLVDLPVMSHAQLQRLVHTLAGHGVAMMPRDVHFHPRLWHVRTSPPSPVDPASLAIGALVVLFGLLEVVLIVGSAFAVGARRQVRELGLLAASGGAPSDVRRVLLGQGLVLGVVASVLGAAAGIGLFFAGLPLYERVAATTFWSHEITWTSVVGVTLLGSVTGMIAALVPAWSIGRLTPVAALAGRFPIRQGESAAHRPAFLLMAVGVLTLVLSGWWTAREYAPRPVRPGADEFANPPSLLPVVLGGLGLLVLVAGVVWSAPYVVRRVAALGRGLPLSGRFAFRDAARHRFRTAAAAVALTITVGGAVFTGFVVNSVAATVDSESRTPPNSMSLDIGYSQRSGGPDRVRTMLQTVEHVVGPVTSYVASDAYRPGRRNYESLSVKLGRGNGDAPVAVVDEKTLRFVVGDDVRALDSFRSGAAVTIFRHRIRHGKLTLALPSGGRSNSPGNSPGNSSGNRWQLPATVVSAQHNVGDFNSTWISRATAARLGLRTRPMSALVLTSGPVTNDELARLSVYGIDGWSSDSEAAQVRLVFLGAIGAAGLLTALVVGIAVALASAEGKSDTATMAAVGAGPWRRRSFGAMHGVFLGLVGGLLGLGIGLAAGLSLSQVDGLPGVAVPWVPLLGTVLVVPLLAALASWLVTPTRLSLVRRAS